MTRLLCPRKVPMIRTPPPLLCHRKRQYDTVLSAMRAVRDLRRHGKADRDSRGEWVDPGTLVAYLCEHCNFFHTGHARPKDGAA